MAFRTVAGQDYKAKNSLDDWIEKQEERSRTGKRVENSLAHNAAQAAVLASDAVSRGLHKGWVMAQKGAWAVKQMQLEAELASSGMQQGMQTAAASQRQERAQIVVEPLQPISLQTVRQVGPMVTIKWTTKLFVGNSSRTEALLSITQAQVMVNGKFRPQTFPLGLRESGERKLELTVDVGDPGDHAVQIRQLDNEKWSRWSEAHAVQVSKSATPSAKLQRRKTTAKAETGIFSRALSAGGAPLFLATISQEGTTPDNMPGKSTLETSAGPDAAEKETTEKHDDGASTHAVGRPEKEQGAYAEKGKEPPSEPPAALGKAPAAAPMFGRTISAPAAPAWLLRRSASVAVNPSALETSLDASAHKVLDNSMSSSLDTSTTRDEETLKAADTASQQRIAPSRARAGATATFSRAMSAPTVPSPGATGAPANRNESVERAKPRVPSPPTDEREGGFRRTGSAARAAAAGIARFRRAASTVTSVLRVASAGKDREVGTGGEGQNAGENAKDDLHMKSAERSDGFAMFGFKRTMSAPSAPIGDGFARTTSDAAKSSATSAFARLRDLPFSAKENETAGPAAERPESPQEQSIGIEVHLGLSVPLINGAKEIQIKSAVAAMAGVNGEALVIDGLENAWSGSRMHLRLAIPQSNVDKVRLRINLDRLNLELKRSNLPNAKGIKEEKPGFKAANLKKRHTIGASGQGGLSGMDFSEFSKLMGNEEPSQMSLTIDVIAPKYEVMLMYDSLQEGILETTALNKWPKSSVKFLSQHEVKGTRLQPSKVIVAWNLEAPARARDMMLEAMEDSETGLRKWAEKKGLPQVKVVELTITKVAKPISRFKRAATKVSIANSFLAAAKRNVEATEDSGQFTRSTSAPGIQIAESQELDQSSLSLDSQGPELGGFKRTPSAPDAVGPFTASKPASEKGVDKDPSDGAGVHERGSSIVEPMITSPGITTRINSNNLAITRTSSGGVYVHPAAEKPRTSAILPFFSRAESAVKSEIAYEDDHFSRVPSGASVHEGGAAGGRDFSRASSAERAAGFLLQASQGVLNIFSRASSSASQTKTGSGEDKFSRAGSSGDDVFSRAGSARSDAKFSRAGSAAPAETTSGTNSLGESADAAQMSLFRREEESVHTDGISTVLPSIQKYSAATGADEGPKTPIMHIEPRRLGIKKAYHKPSTTAAGSGVKRLVKPKSSGGAADEFERAPSLTTLAPPKPKTAPKEESQAAIDAKRVRKTRRRNGYAAHTWSSGETYEGEWKDGVMHGKGFYRYADDYRDENRARAMDHMHRYEGEFREGKFNGKGIKHSQNGDRYEGDFLDGKFHGRGVFFCKETGETYEGGFWKGRFHGRGVQLSKDGSRLSVLYDAKKQDS